MAVPQVSRPVKKPDYILTPEQVDFFWDRLHYWQEKLGLGDWRITRGSKPPPKKNLCQLTDWDTQQRQVCCRLNLNWGSVEMPTPKIIEQTVVHELLHIMLHPLIEVSRTAQTEYDENVQSAEHGVINRLEQLLVPV